MPMTHTAIDISTTEQVVNCVLANNYAVHVVEEEALKVDDGIALALDEPMRCHQTEHTFQVDE